VLTTQIQHRRNFRSPRLSRFPTEARSRGPGNVRAQAEEMLREMAFVFQLSECIKKAMVAPRALGK
jgi:hypothetical protein